MSDHRATYSELNLKASYKPAIKARKAFDRAEWNTIGERVLQQISPRKVMKIRPAVDEIVQNLIETTTAAVNWYTDIRPTLYLKAVVYSEHQDVIHQGQSAAPKMVSILCRGWTRTYPPPPRQTSTSLFRETRGKRRA